MNFTWDGTLVTDRERELSPVPNDTRIVGISANLQSAPEVIPLIYRIQSEPGASPGEYIEQTIEVGSLVPDAVSTGEVLVLGDMGPWLRIVQGSGSWLEGTLHLSSVLAVPAGLDLCTLDEVKQMMEPTPTGEDAQIQSIISGVSGRMQDYTQRKFKRATYIAERHDLGGSELLVTNQPLQSVAEVRENGEVVPAEDYTIYRDGRIYHISRNWYATPSKPIEVDYDGGNETTDSEYLSVNRLCVKQVLHEYKQERLDRVGEQSLALDAGGTQSYVVADWLPEVKSGLLRLRRFA